MPLICFKEGFCAYVCVHKLWLTLLKSKSKCYLPKYLKLKKDKTDMDLSNLYK